MAGEEEPPPQLMLMLIAPLPLLLGKGGLRAALPTARPGRMADRG